MKTSSVAHIQVQQSDQTPELKSRHLCLLGGSWVVISRVKSRLTTSQYFFVTYNPNHKYP